MKLFLLTIFTGCLSTAFATNYYFSSTYGDDTRSPAQARKSATPWKSISKLNSIFNTFQPGDSVLLKKDDTFYGSIIVTKSGSTDQPIVIASYGSGKLPVITGFVTLSKWDSKGNGIFSSSQTLDDSSLNMVLINNSEYAMGRYPNANNAGNGWIPIISHMKNNSITAAPPFPNLDWTSAEIVVRKKHYVIDRNRIISQAGSTLNYKSGSQYEPGDGFGFFIQNHIATLDQFGEWYYDPSSKQLNLYFGKGQPSGFTIKASNIDVLVTIKKQNNISFENLAFEGSDAKSFYLYYSKNIHLKNCVINFSGLNAIEGYNTQNVQVQNCVISNSNNNAFDLMGNCIGTQVKSNLVSNSGSFSGMAGNSPHSFIGINVNGDNVIIENNKVDSSGYAAILFSGNSVIIRNNFVNYFCLLKDDGGGIYTGNNMGNPKKDQLIENNIVLNGIGASEGTPDTYALASGIYLDDNSANITVTGNSMAYCSKGGIFLHNCHEVDVTKNTVYSNATQIIIQKDAASTALVRNNTVMNNIFVSKDASQFTASFFTNSNATDIDSFGRIDSNYYSRPVDDSVTISTSYVDKPIGKINKFYSLKEWKSGYNKDLSSKKSSFQMNAFKINDLGKVNKVSNGNFDKNQPGINGFRCKMAWENSGILDGGYLKVTSLPNFSNSYITIPVGSIQVGKNYILRFTLAGADSDEKTIGIYLRANGAPYANLAQKVYRNIPRARHNYEIVFNAVKDDPNALLIFALNEPNVTYSTDNIQLYETNATITRPEDHLLFVYNPGSSPKKFSLKGSYKDIRNEAYLNSIVLAPNSSAILMKQN